MLKVSTATHSRCHISIGLIGQRIKFLFLFGALFIFENIGNDDNLDVIKGGKERFLNFVSMKLHAGKEEKFA